MALNQSVSERKQLRENLDQVQRAHEQSSDELTQLREHIEPSQFDRLDRQATAEGGVQPATVGWSGGAFDEDASSGDDVPPSGSRAFRSSREGP